MEWSKNVFENKFKNIYENNKNDNKTRNNCIRAISLPPIARWTLDFWVIFASQYKINQKKTRLVIRAHGLCRYVCIVMAWKLIFYFAIGNWIIKIRPTQFPIEIYQNGMKWNEIADIQMKSLILMQTPTHLDVGASQHIANTPHLFERNSLFVAFKSNPDAYLFHWFLCVPFVSPFLWYWQIAIEKRMKIIKISERKMFNISCIWTSPQLKLKLKREKEKKEISLNWVVRVIFLHLASICYSAMCWRLVSLLLPLFMERKIEKPNIRICTHIEWQVKLFFSFSLSLCSICSCGFCGKIELSDDKRQRPKTEKDFRSGRLFYRETQLSINRYLNPFERFRFHPNDWNNAHF